MAEHAQEPVIGEEFEFEMEDDLASTEESAPSAVS